MIKREEKSGGGLRKKKLHILKSIRNGLRGGGRKINARLSWANIYSSDWIKISGSMHTFAWVENFFLSLHRLFEFPSIFSLSAKCGLLFKFFIFIFNSITTVTMKRLKSSQEGIEVCFGKQRTSISDFFYIIPLQKKKFPQWWKKNFHR